MTSRPHTSPPPPVRTVLSPIGPTVESWERAHEPLAWSSNFINKSGRSCSRRERSWERAGTSQQTWEDTSLDSRGFWCSASVFFVTVLRHTPQDACREFGPNISVRCGCRSCQYELQAGEAPRLDGEQKGTFILRKTWIHFSGYFYWNTCRFVPQILVYCSTDFCKEKKSVFIIISLNKMCLIAHVELSYEFGKKKKVCVCY